MIQVLGILLFTLFSCSNNLTTDDLLKIKDDNIKIVVPYKNTLYPSDLGSPYIWWRDLAFAKSWIITLSTQNNIIFQKRTSEPELFIDKKKWRKISQEFPNQDIYLFIEGFASRFIHANRVSFASTNFTISQDPLDALVFYRSVPLPIPGPKEYGEIHWMLGDPSTGSPPDILMSGQKECMGCHTFAKDGSTMGIEVNTNPKDKGSMAIKKISETITITPKDIFKWDEKNNITSTLSELSPNRQYIIGSIYAIPTLVAYDTIEKHFPFYFWPVQGKLAFRELNNVNTNYFLKGADSDQFAHTSPTWSPDGQYIIFSRAKARPDLLKMYTNGDAKKLLDYHWSEIDKQYGMKFSLYKIPFKNGTGGIAKPILGASHDGMNSILPRVSPNKKWIVYTRSAYAGLVRPDSDLYIIPFSGGKTRRLNANSHRADSWHSWSPNGKWLLFSSKRFSSNTGLFVTHVDEDGNDSPPVYLAEFKEENKAVNQPDFILRKASVLKKMKIDL